MGYDQRFRWPAFQRVPVDAGVTSVSVLNETARTLIAGGTAVRAIDATSTKPAIGGTVTMTAASIKYLENGDIENIVSQDLRLAYADGLDFHTNAQIVAVMRGAQTATLSAHENAVLETSSNLNLLIQYRVETFFFFARRLLTISS